MIRTVLVRASAIPTRSQVPPVLLLRCSFTTTPSPLASSPPPPPPRTNPHPYLSQLHGVGTTAPSGSGLAGDSPGVGPFPLPGGLGGFDRDEDIRKAERKWRELKRGEKLGRAWTQVSSLVVVMAGVSIAGLVLYSTGTELASPSSPTRVFEDCTERVKASEELKTLLLEPYAFHGASSSNRLRRNRRVSSSLTHDPNTGADILQIRFFIEAGSLPSPSTIPEGSLEYYWDAVKSYVGPLIWEDSHKPGSFVPSSVREKERQEDEERERLKREEELRRGSWGGWVRDGLASMVGGLVPRSPAAGSSGGSGGKSLFKAARKPSLGEYTTGEGVAELKKDPESNTFVYQQLYVDVPDSHSPNRYRVHISTATVESGGSWPDKLRFWKVKEPAV